ncbi:mesenchyme-specific cell surface glycoprotein [Elysia marginata]|uniref:Mesenchyme-specific cell surface glycoprotein n=1 Tax=Elysia marginata TaxID=1093978 RepID=A0AAV4FN49_9GAST|nr:mesenchyme-specific cell surface glycoprotein [Elysia marginata]
MKNTKKHFHVHKLLNHLHHVRELSPSPTFNTSPPLYRLYGLAVRHSLRDRDLRDSIPGRVKPKTFKLVLAADPPSVRHYGFSVKSGRPGKDVLHVVDAADPNNMRAEYTRYENHMIFTDIDLCLDHVFVTVRSRTDTKPSALRVYKTYVKNRSDPLELVREYPVGNSPDMLTVLENCRTVIVADEEDAYKADGKIVDPEGHVTIVHFPDAIDYAKDMATINLLGFGAFNDRYQEMKPSGVRFVSTGNNNKLSNDLEPEYIVVDEETNKAYVILQENNAVAEVDLTTRNITNIRGLGYKQWGSLDASDRDGGIQISYWPIRSWYLPDTAKLHRWQGHNLLFTVNEGADKEYSWFDELVRGADIVKSGRLQFSRYDGRDARGKYCALYTYGGRSFSIWDMTPGTDQWSTLPQVFDSGSQLEELTALHCPHLFNRENDMDGRSDNKGSEPESLDLGVINNRLYIFVGLERPGPILVYSLGDDVTRPRFETIFCEGIPDTSKTMEEMFEDREIYGVDPEDIQ